MLAVACTNRGKKVKQKLKHVHESIEALDNKTISNMQRVSALYIWLLLLSHYLTIKATLRNNRRT